MNEDKFLSTTELAKILGISRIAVYKKIKNGMIKATKVGRNFIIDKKDLGDILGGKISEKSKKKIDTAVKKVVKDYGETLRLLGKND